MSHGNIFIISAPSGAGKSSLVKALCQKDNKIKVSVSHTTRMPRVGEEHGTDYHFISKEVFQEMLNNEEFVEHALVFDNYYGTHILTLKELLQNGFDIILEIDWQGAMQVKHIFPEAISIFILPPNKKELEYRLYSRNTDSKEVIEKRLSLAVHDISYAKEFDYVIINDIFDKALHDLYSIIWVNRLKSNIILKNYVFE